MRMAKTPGHALSESAQMVAKLKLWLDEAQVYPGGWTLEQAKNTLCSRTVRKIRCAAGVECSTYTGEAEWKWLLG